MKRFLIQVMIIMKLFFLMIFLTSNHTMDVMASGSESLNPDFSHESGFYDAGFNLILTPKTGTSIYYTVDSSEPDERSIPYVGPIAIEEAWVIADGSEVLIQRNLEGDPIPEPSYPISMIRTGPQKWQSPKEDILKATVIKAIAIDDQTGERSQTLTNTYFVTDGMTGRYSMPVMAISTDINNLFDYETGIHVPGIHYDPTIPEDGHDNRTGNYFQTGDAWEKPVHVEYFDASGALLFEQGAGIRIHGSLSRKYPIKSYRLYADDQYDAYDYFNFSFFEDKDIHRFKRIILRAGGQTYEYTFMGEAAAQSVIKPLGLDMQYAQPVILFVNGEYFGIRTLRDRLDRYYLETHYGVDPDGVTILTGHGYYEDGEQRGSSQYMQLYAYIVGMDMKDDRKYQYVQTKMDIENFIDYYISEIYFANQDWPQNNVLYWKKNTSYDPDAPMGHDGRWRWMIYDIDAGFGASWGGYHPDVDVFERLTGDSWKTGKMLLNLMENESFKAQFVYRFFDLLDTVFEPERVKTLVSDMVDLYEPEMPEHIARFGYPVSYQTWKNYTDRMITFADQRPDVLRTQLVEHLALGNALMLDTSYDDTMGSVSINSLVLADGQTSYQVYERLSVTMKAIPLAGHRFVGWYDTTGRLLSGKAQMEVRLFDDYEIEARFELGDPVIEPETSDVLDVLIYLTVFGISVFGVLGYLLYRQYKAHRFPFRNSDTRSVDHDM